MGTLNDITLKNNFGEQTSNQVIPGQGTLALARIAVGFADLNAAGTTVALAISAALPISAIIKNVYYNVTTAFTDNGTAGNANTSTISLGANTNVDLKAAAALSGFAVGISPGIPINTAATMVKLTAARQLKAVWTKGTGDSTLLVTGQMNVYVEYVLGT